MMPDWDLPTSPLSQAQTDGHRLPTPNFFLEALGETTPTSPILAPSPATAPKHNNQTIMDGGWDFSSAGDDIEQYDPTPRSRAQRLQDLCDDMRNLTTEIKQQSQRVSGSRDMWFSYYVKNNIIDGPGMPKKEAATQHQHPPREGKATLTSNLANDEDDIDEADEEKYFDYYNLANADPGMTTDQWSEDRLVRYLKGLYDSEIIPMHEVAQEYDTTSLQNGFMAKPHQLRAASCIERARGSGHKGLLIADQPGLGKTLEALLPLAHLRIQAKRQRTLGPDVVIAPPSLCRQWQTEAYKFFGDQISVFIVANSAIPPSELYKHDIVVVSYPHLTNERTRMCRYLREAQKYCQNDTQIMPERPRTPLLAELHQWGKGLGQFLVLDEAHTIKNTHTAAFQATLLLRHRMDTCIMLSATPMDNSWTDVFAYIKMLKGHNITTFDRFVKAFTGLSGQQRVKVPAPPGYYLGRIQQMVHSFTLGRSKKVDQDETQIRPDPVAVHMPFKPDPDDQKKSDKEFDRWIRTTGREEYTAFGGLIKSVQILMHRKLEWILDLIRREACKQGNQVLSQAEREQLQEFETWIVQDDNHRSPRIDKLEWLLQAIRDKHPMDKVVVMDESKYFLKIVTALLKVMNFPPEYIVYDGDVSTEDRDRKLKAFREHQGFAVLLITRGTGGLGLNLQVANHIILCGQWWKESAIVQALGRVDRHGQLKPVYWYQLEALDCKVEKYKQKVRKEKSDIIGSVERPYMVDFEPGPKPEPKKLIFAGHPALA